MERTQLTINLQFPARNVRETDFFQVQHKLHLIQNFKKLTGSKRILNHKGHPQLWPLFSIPIIHVALLLLKYQAYGDYWYYPHITFLNE